MSLIKIAFNDYKKVIEIEMDKKTTTPKKCLDLTFSSKNKTNYKNVFLNKYDLFEKGLDKKLFNQNRWIVELEDNNLKKYLTLISNISFGLDKFDKKTLFEKPKEKDLDIIFKMIDFNITHSLKTLNTTFNNNIYVTNLATSSYGIDSSTLSESKEKLPISTTEGNGAVNSKFPIFFYNFILNGQVLNIIELIKTNKKVFTEVLSNYIDSKSLKEIIKKATEKENVKINGYLGYQTIIDISNKESETPEYINISPAISIPMIHKINNINAAYVNNITEEDSEIKNEDLKDKTRFFVKKEGYSVGGTQPQNVNPYFSFQAGKVNALSVSIPTGFTIDAFEEDMKKIQFRKTLFKKVYIDKETKKETVRVIESLYSIQNKDKLGFDIKKKVLKRLNMYTDQIISEITYLQDNYTRKDFEIYIDSESKKSVVDKVTLKARSKLNENEINLIFGHRNKEDRKKLKDYTEIKLTEYINEFINSLNVKTINENNKIKNSLIKDLVISLKKELGVD